MRTPEFFFASDEKSLNKQNPVSVEANEIGFLLSEDDIQETLARSSFPPKRLVWSREVLQALIDENDNNKFLKLSKREIAERAVAAGSRYKISTFLSDYVQYTISRINSTAATPLKIMTSKAKASTNGRPASVYFLVYR